MAQPLSLKGYFAVFITALLPEYESAFVTELIKKGYMVSVANPKSPTITYGAKGTPASLLVLKVFSTNKNLSPHDLVKDVEDIGIDKKLFFYSVVVGEMANCNWIGSNFYLPQVIPVTSSADRSLN
jgi:hypothetical protein